MAPRIRLPANALAAVWRRLPTPIQRVAVVLRGTLYTAAVVAVVLDDQGRVLVLQHPFHRRPWGLPGGFVARGEQPEGAMRREVSEEVGLTLAGLELARVLSSASIPHLEIVFLAHATGAPRPDGFEVTDARWVAPSDLPAYLHRDKLDLVRSVLGRQDAGTPPGPRVH